jgi:hypothetical protein
MPVEKAAVVLRTAHPKYFTGVVAGEETDGRAGLATKQTAAAVVTKAACTSGTPQLP